MNLSERGYALAIKSLLGPEYHLPLADILPPEPTEGKGGLLSDLLARHSNQIQLPFRNIFNHRNVDLGPLLRPIVKAGLHGISDAEHAALLQFTTRPRKQGQMYSLTDKIASLSYYEQQSILCACHGELSLDFYLKLPCYGSSYYNRSEGYTPYDVRRPYNGVYAVERKYPSYDRDTAMPWINEYLIQFLTSPYCSPETIRSINALPGRRYHLLKHNTQ